MKRFSWDEKGFFLLILLSSLPHFFLHYHRGAHEVVVLALFVVLAPAVLCWRRYPVVSAMVVWAVLFGWTFWLTSGPVDYLDLVPFVLCVPLVVYGPARYSRSAGFSALSLALSLAWGVITPGVFLGAFVPDEPIPDSLVTAVVLMQWVFSCGVFVMGHGQRQDEARHEATLRARGREDRLAMAREIHDVLSRSLTVINVQATAGVALDDAGALERVRDTSAGALAEVRSLLASLRATSDVVTAGTRSKDDLVTAMREMLGGFEAVGLQIEARFPSGDERDRLVEIESALVQFIHYRILGETLTNVLRHQGPQSRVLLVTTADIPANVLDVRVESWAGSQAPALDSPDGAGMGLAGLRDRVEDIGGVLRWWSDSGDPRHFVVEATMPVVVESEKAVRRRWPKLVKEKWCGR
ncbi:MAG: sensor histidine kinase [Corynebacterium sp.]|uniref:sensor histidine kinase n=1 Tax=Corynebacterium sp. TaxID=1720 RepID=UPI003F0C153A